MTPDTEPTSASWLPLLAPHLSTAGIDGAVAARLESRMALLPPTVTAALEIRLGASGGPVDLAARVAYAAEAATIAAHPGLGTAGEYLAAWARAADSRVPFLWLEFDLPPGRESIRPLLIPRLTRSVADDWLVDVLLPRLRGAPPTPPQRTTLLGALQGLPAGAFCCYTFDLQARGTSAVRLSFADLIPAAMPARLTALGRDDLATPVRRAVELVHHADRHELNFDIDATGALAPRVGVEASFASWPSRDQRWQDLLDRLIAEGLCTEERRDAVLAWCGYDSSATAALRWPAVPQLAGSHLVRWLSHVKLVCTPGAALEAKAYLLFGVWTRGADGRLKEGPPPLAAKVP